MANNTKKPTRDELVEQVKALSKEELLALIFMDGVFFWRFALNQRNINMAKGHVIRAKADAAFAKWEELVNKRATDPPHDNSLEGQIAFLKSVQESEGWYKKYQVLSSKADKLQFGHLDHILKQETDHAAE